MAKEFSCREAGFDCDFMIRSENEDEMIEFIKDHARQTHDKDMSSSDVRDALQSA